MPTLPPSPKNQKVDLILRKKDVEIIGYFAKYHKKRIGEFIREIVEAWVAEFRELISEEKN